MNASSGPVSGTSMAAQLRPETQADTPFLAALYASTRQPELDAAGWDATTSGAFLQMQFQCQQAGYHGTYPRAQFSIILLGDQPVGRIVVDRAGAEIRVVDIALLPQYRGRSLGAALLQAVLTEGVATRKPVRLRVRRTNPAARLYARLGFVPVQEDELDIHMERSPPPGST